MKEYCVQVTGFLLNSPCFLEFELGKLACIFNLYVAPTLQIEDLFGV